MNWLKTADIFLAIFHIGFTLFNLLGWMWYAWRRAHLVTVALTLISWLIMGLFYGFGYCFLTDWHWNVKRQLGETGLPSSFVKYYLDILFQADTDAQVVNVVTVCGLVLAVVMTVLRNKDLIRR